MSIEVLKVGQIICCRHGKSVVTNWHWKVNPDQPPVHIDDWVDRAVFDYPESLIHGPNPVCTFCKADLT